MNDTLFPPTPEERLEALEKFARTERFHRYNMLTRQPERREYWSVRIADADKALEHLAALKQIHGVAP